MHDCAVGDVRLLARGDGNFPFPARCLLCNVIIARARVDSLKQAGAFHAEVIPAAMAETMSRAHGA
jgi:hypothetical protein